MRKGKQPVNQDSEERMRTQRSLPRGWIRAREPKDPKDEQDAIKEEQNARSPGQKVDAAVKKFEDLEDPSAKQKPRENRLDFGQRIEAWQN